MDDHSYVRGGQRANGTSEHYGELPCNNDLGDYDHQQLDCLRQNNGKHNERGNSDRSAKTLGKRKITSFNMYICKSGLT